MSDWVQVGGEAQYLFDKGELRGLGASGANAFLHSGKEYSDFVLECEVKIEPGGNSGIQFRSYVDDTGRLRGYQCEIDSSDRWFSGGIYDEGRRGWLENLRGKDKASARSAFKVGEWNHYRIQAKGDRIQTWINGVPCSDLRDSMDDSGVIAFQVHSGGVTDVRWKNISIQELSKKPYIHSVSDISQNFTFYMDGRFFSQYISGDGKDVRNWGTLSKFDFDNANLLILDGGDSRVPYTEQSINTVSDFVFGGGALLMMADSLKGDSVESQPAVKALAELFGGSFSRDSVRMPLKWSMPAFGSKSVVEIDYYSGSCLTLTDDWEVVIVDSSGKPVLAKRSWGMGQVVLASRGLFGRKPDASDSINASWVRPMLLEIVSGKYVNPNKPFKRQWAELFEDIGPLTLEFHEGTRVYADAIFSEYKNVRPYLVELTGVEPSPGMIKKLLILPTGGGGFSSGERIAIGAFWGDYPKNRYPMIELIAHEAGHSWVLPYAEPLWNEPIATYLGIEVGRKMGFKEASLKLERTIAKARELDPTLSAINPFSSEASRDLIWGKSYFVFEQLKKKFGNDVLAKYFRAKRRVLKPGRDSYSMSDCVAVWSIAVEANLFPWFQSLAFPVSEELSSIQGFPRHILQQK